MKFTLRTRLLLIALVSTVLGGIGSGVGIFGMDRIRSELEQVADVDIGALEWTRQAQMGILQTEISRETMVLASWDEQRRDARKELDKNLQTFEAALAQTQSAAERDGSEVIQAVMDSARTWAPEVKGFVEALESEPVGEVGLSVLKRDVAVRTRTEHLISVLQQLADERVARVSLSKQRSVNTSERLLQLIVLVVGVSTAVSAFVCWRLSERVMRQLGAEPDSLAMATAKVADGDLISLDERDAMPGSVLASMKQMQVNLREAILTVSEGAEIVAKSSADITAGNFELSNRTEKQAEHVQLTGSLMEQVNDVMNLHSNHSAEAKASVRRATSVAKDAGQCMLSVNDAMTQLMQTSKQVSEITALIDEIAFQTNILALNAAVESARAGVAGRGFSFVADEVRKLAHRCTEASKDIRSLTTISASQVNSSAAKVSETGRTIDAVIEEISHIDIQVAEMEASNTSLTDAVSQASQSILIIESATQQNSALVEETAAAAESLMQEADHLAVAVRRFKVRPEQLLDASTSAEQA
jgi:methyl-accepting chemotaxis protein